MNKPLFIAAIAVCFNSVQAVTSISKYYLTSDCSDDVSYISIDNDNVWDNLKSETCAQEGARWVNRQVLNTPVDRTGFPSVAQGINLLYFRSGDCTGTPTRIESYKSSASTKNASFQLLSCNGAQASAVWSDGDNRFQQTWSAGCQPLSGEREKSVAYQCRNLIGFNAGSRVDVALLSTVGTMFGGLMAAFV